MRYMMPYGSSWKRTEIITLNDYDYEIRPCKCSIELPLLYVECLGRGRVQDYFGGAYKHFWEKWNSLASKSILGAAERFYAELSDNNRELLVNRAVALYDGKATREEPHDEDVYVCDACGSRKIEIQVWVNANTNEYLSDVDDDDTDCNGARTVNRVRISAH